LIEVLEDVELYPDAGNVFWVASRIPLQLVSEVVEGRSRLTDKSIVRLIERRGFENALSLLAIFDAKI
jgi:hypothetical protein